MPVKRKKVLILIPYQSIYPPLNGGMLRCFHLLRQLCRNYDVSALIRQEAKSFEESFKYYPELKNCRIYSLNEYTNPADAFSLLPSNIASALRYRFWNRSLKGPADSTYLDFYRILQDVLRNNTFDLVVLENLATIPLASAIKKKLPDAVIVYDAHNVDTYLLNQLTELPVDAKNKTYQLESNLYRSVDAIITCSIDDLRAFQSMNAGQLAGTTIPNGVELRSRPQRKVHAPGSPYSILFVGSLDYQPNSDGLIWFFDQVLPELKKTEVPFVIDVVGSGQPQISLQKIFNTEGGIVRFHGKAESLQEFYENAAVAVVPILTGSGTRLKVLEAMGHGTPVVSTSKGAEGINYKENSSICLAGSSMEFAAQIIRLVEDKNFANTISENAFALVKNKYEWNLIGNSLFEFLDSLALK